MLNFLINCSIFLGIVVAFFLIVLAVLIGGYAVVSFVAKAIDEYKRKRY